ncbi:aminotransferase class V [Hydrogenispora ethanolica]|uniref:Aminotransferase class V n=1 Tax=Hydrogenispora ethanolica TaxID=1082276 RepID=A0A4R1SAL4_HYDET|nr:aminotransferase class V-fold PLP-dependent enzyme [Hydrogenispora ethanolica]TCL76511.1 aminotransferase class V [Hydrogenispora ethanolica]
MNVYPLPAIDLEQAMAFQFRLVDLIHRNFEGAQFLQGGDYGLVPETGRPAFTARVERVIAQFFEAEDAALVRGAGTGAIRSVLNAMVPSGSRILLHRAPVYPTTRTTIEAMGLQPVTADYNDLASLDAQELSGVGAALVQSSRQQPEDRYDLGEVIRRLKTLRPELMILVDDNYVVMKVPRIGAQLGADASAFSLFKLLGPPGIGCVVGARTVVERIRDRNYSGGGQVQGGEAMEALRALVYAPVALAIQARVGEEIVARLNRGEVPGVKAAWIANAQSRVVLVELEQPVAPKVLAHSAKLGAAPYPVGAESRYEIAAMFYRVSGTFLKANPDWAHTLIRINPMRAGADTVIRVLREALAQVVD